jgi:hypothetical protein
MINIDNHNKQGGMQILGRKVEHGFWKVSARQPVRMRKCGGFGSLGKFEELKV